MEPRLRLRIEAPGLVARNARIFLGDIDISRNVIDLELSLSQETVTTAVLRLRPDELEVDAEALLSLRAEVEA